MKTTETIFLNIARGLGIRKLEVSKEADRRLGSDLINRNLFFYVVMEELLNEDNLSTYTDGDCDPDTGGSSSWEEPAFWYAGDWMEIEKFGLKEISRKDVIMLFWNESTDDWEGVTLDEEHYKILTYILEDWRDEINEQARSYSGNAMRDCSHRWSDFI